jgi:excisionase family DNA binding protein
MDEESVSPTRQSGPHERYRRRFAAVVPRETGVTWLTVKEAAHLLRVPVSWLYERTRTNSIPHVKLGKYLRFDRDELTAWVDELKRDGRGPTVSRRPSRPAVRTSQR